jgi:hypothetical protein
LCRMGGGRQGEIEGTAEVTAANHVLVRATITRTRGYGQVASRPLTCDFTRTAPGCATGAVLSQAAKPKRPD